VTLGCVILAKLYRIFPDREMLKYEYAGFDDDNNGDDDDDHDNNNKYLNT
jgi:hypothetical protein